MKIQKKNREGGGGGCEQRNEVFVKIKKKSGIGAEGGGGVRVDLLNYLRYQVEIFSIFYLCGGH